MTSRVGALFRFVVGVWIAVLSVCVRRLRRGPGRPSWTVRQEIAVEALRRNGAYLTSVSAEQARRHLIALARPATAKGVVVERVQVGDLPGVWFRPRASRTGGALLYFIGGGYVLGEIESYRDVLSRLADAAGATVLAVRYRQAPEHVFPVAVDDCVQAWRWLRERVPAAERIVIAGDSAGGALTLATLLRLRDAGDAPPAAAALISPWVDLSASSASVTAHERWDWGGRDYLLHWARQYVTEAEARDPLASPLHADLTALAPLLILVGDAELLRDEVVALADRARAAGTPVTLHVYPDMVHAWQLLPDVFPQGRAALEEIAAFVHANLAPPA